MLILPCWQTITNFLAMGPPWPLAPEEALQARERAYDTLDSFGGWVALSCCSPSETFQKLTTTEPPAQTTVHHSAIVRAHSVPETAVHLAA